MPRLTSSALLRRRLLVVIPPKRLGPLGSSGHSAWHLILGYKLQETMSENLRCHPRSSDSRRVEVTRGRSCLWEKELCPVCVPYMFPFDSVRSSKQDPVAYLVTANIYGEEVELVEYKSL
jgi:hypothetical protein